MTRHARRRDTAVRWALALCGCVFCGCVVFAGVDRALAAYAAVAAVVALLGGLVCVRYLQRGRQ